ncbi:MAG: saccharopine dehydrogenase NADP-binding domain-containing protein [Polyangiaceae bacterium]|nr:saccharopine dehydrogenase NADP-binding domain-containing protein [Polyangiaceae bacterium]
MKVLIFGGHGRMGRAAAWDLVRRDEVEQVGLAARRKDALEDARSWLKSPKTALHVLDVDDRTATQALMRSYNVGINSLPDRRASYSTVDAASEIGFSLVDILEEYHRRPDAYEIENLRLPPNMRLDEYGEHLHARAAESGATILDGMGFAPGLSNITVGHGIRRLDAAESVTARVGGIPSRKSAENHPLRYMVTWAFEHVLREYMIKVDILEDGRVKEVDALTGRERFHFNRLGKDEWLECAVTPGMPSFLFTRPNLKAFSEKTVRWPGHYDGIDVLKSCGMLDIEPVSVDGRAVSPRAALLAALLPRLRALPGDTDAAVMWNTVDGLKDGIPTRISFSMWDEPDPAQDISAMGRVTGFPAAIGAVMLGRGMIKERGLVPPEEAIYGENYRWLTAELLRRNIRIEERIEPLAPI